MKTAISLPDTLYKDAEKIAVSMGIPRSQLFAKALEEFIKHHKKEAITERLNALYDNSYMNDGEIDNAGLEAIRKLTQNDTW
ncbi:MAG: ChpI protein [Spirochaetes bacterium]|nr:ChpI protein [Spirochaetota bacterium]MBU0953899.1 ChpI protein [Spirochaetota bacterium]